MYLTVNKDHDYAIEGTININNAAPFHIVPFDGSHSGEFMLVYYGEKSAGKSHQLRRGISTFDDHLQQAVQPVPRYLNAGTNIRGKNSGPLHMLDSVKECCARLVLQSRIKSRHSKTVEDVDPWLSGREVYFIRCTRRLFKKGYLCVNFKAFRQNGPLHKTRIVPSTDSHDNENKFMLFRLLPYSLKAKLKSAAEGVDSGLDEEGRQWDTRT